MIRGIGPIYAKKLVRAFGDAVFDVIEREPGRLREVTGIGPKRAERIVGGWVEQKVIREIMLFLHSNGVGTSRAMRIYKTYGAEAVQLSRRTPIAWPATSAALALYRRHHPRNNFVALLRSRASIGTPPSQKEGRGELLNSSR
jgi:ATP-dependent exoDNAse (exonuclease V) alpha subunit